MIGQNFDDVCVWGRKLALPPYWFVLITRNPEVYKVFTIVMFCMAPGCSNEGYCKEGIHYHRLPLKDGVKLSKWLNAMKLKNPPVNRFSRICSDHFEQECFERDLRAELMGTKPKHLLKDSAVPTLKV